MNIEIRLDEKVYAVDLQNGKDISIPLHSDGPRAWYVDRMNIRPVETDSFIGSVAHGGSVNFREITFNPHGHGTHTETFEHISEERISVYQALSLHHFLASVITVTPSVADTTSEWMKAGDLIIHREDLLPFKEWIQKSKALVIRTLPNHPDKKFRNYSNTNFPYVHADAMRYIVECGIEHLLIDLPSVDREEDGGLLLAHHVFWGETAYRRQHCTITEFIFVDDSILDGRYLLNLQVAPFVNDATPSRPILYPLRPLS